MCRTCAPCWPCAEGRTDSIWLDGAGRGREMGSFCACLLFLLFCGCSPPYSSPFLKKKGMDGWTEAPVENGMERGLYAYLRILTWLGDLFALFGHTALGALSLSLWLFVLFLFTSLAVSLLRSRRASDEGCRSGQGATGKGQGGGMVFFSLLTYIHTCIAGGASRQASRSSEYILVAPP